MLPKENSFYSILTDFVIPIGTFIVGVILERALKITFRITNIVKDERQINQSQTIDGENNNSVQTENVYGDMFVGTKKGAIDSPPSKSSYKSYQLPHDDRQFALFVEEKLNYFDLNNARFKEIYEGGYRCLNDNSIGLASSEYYRAFRNVKEVFLDRSKYRETPPEELRSGFKQRLEELKKFSNREDINKDELSELIEDMKDNIVDLSKHLP